jgi:hypothetical protein
MSLNLTIEFKKSILDDLQLVEQPNKDALKKLLQSDYLINNIEWDEKKKLTQYLSFLDGDAKKVLYKRKDKLKFGRVYPLNSLGAIALRRQIRHTLFKHNMTDIDVVNAMPTMLYQICKYNNIDCEYLEYYILNREAILKEIMNEYKVSREQAKDLFIRLLFFGGFDKWAYDCNIADKKAIKLITDFKKELNYIADTIVNNNSILLKEVKKIKELNGKETNDIRGSLVSHYLQEYEIKVLETVYNYCISNDYIKNNICSLCHDGIMIETINFKNELLNELNKEVKQKIGFDLTFIVKDMNEDYIEDIKNIEIPIDKKIENDTDASDIIYSTIKDNFKCCYICKTHMIFYKYSNIWADNEEFIKIKLASLISNFGLYKIKKTKTKYGIETEKVEFGRNNFEIKNVIEILINTAKNNIDNDFYNKLHTSTKGKLCFQDGVLDVEKQKFFLWSDEELIKNPIYTVAFINRNFKNFYDNNDNDKYVDEVESIIKSIMNEQTERCLEYLSRAIFGYIEDKDFSIFMGNRNCGKGVLSELLENSLTSQYMGVAEADHFLCERETKIDDGRKLMWVIDFQFKRLMITNEIKFDKENKDIKLNGVLLKKLFSGGDKIKSREMYKGYIEFNIQSKLLLMCNDLPKITSNDCLESLVEFNTTNQFKSEEEINNIKLKVEDKIKDITDENQKEFYKLELNKYKLADPTIKDKIKNNENWKNAFILLLLKNWKNTKILINSDNRYDEEEETLTDIIYKFCDYKIDNSYTISNEELKNICNISKCSMKKLKIELYGMGASDFKNNNIRGLRNFKLKDEFKKNDDYE